MMGIDNLIKALQIFRKYGNPAFPTHCEHDVTMVLIDPSLVSEEDKKELDDLGFQPDHYYNCFRSYVFGSA